MAGRAGVIVTILAGVILLVASCARQAETQLPGPGDGAKASQQNGVAGGDRQSIKTSAGARIYGSPEKIVVIKGDKKTVLKRGSLLDRVRDAGERIMLRFGNAADEPSVSNEQFSKMVADSPAVVQFYYNKLPEFAVMGKYRPSASVYGQEPSITFFISLGHAPDGPDTIYDGFFFGGVRMVSTLTNYDLVNVIKGMK